MEGAVSTGLTCVRFKHGGIIGVSNTLSSSVTDSLHHPKTNKVATDC